MPSRNWNAPTDLTPENRSGPNVRIRAWSDSRGGVQDGKKRFQAEQKIGKLREAEVEISKGQRPTQRPLGFNDERMAQSWNWPVEYEGPTTEWKLYDSLRPVPQFNTVIVALTQRKAWVWFNDISIGEPTVVPDVFPPRFSLTMAAPSTGRVEFERMKVWDETAIPAKYLDDR